VIATAVAFRSDRHPVACLLKRPRPTGVENGKDRTGQVIRPTGQVLTPVGQRSPSTSVTVFRQNLVIFWNELLSFWYSWRN